MIHDTVARSIREPLGSGSALCSADFFIIIVPNINFLLLIIVYMFFGQKLSGRLVEAITADLSVLFLHVYVKIRY